MSQLTPLHQPGLLLVNLNSYDTSYSTNQFQHRGNETQIINFGGEEHFSGRFYARDFGLLIGNVL